MTASRRRDACPSLATPMETGDGLLVRLNSVSGGLSPAQLRDLAGAASRHGNGIIEVTARGNIQLRGLDEPGVEGLKHDIDRIGIVVRSGVAVETGPLAGVDPEELADPRALVDAINAAIATAGLAARLGPKVSVVVDGGGRWPLDQIAGDVRCVATRTAGVTAWRMALGGDAATAKPLGVMSPPAAVQKVLAVLSAIADLGRRARGRDLAHADPRGDRAEAALRLAEGHLGQRPPLRLLALRDGVTALAVALPFGSVAAAQLIDFAERTAAFGASEIRPAPGRALVVLGLDADRCADLQREAASLGFVVDPADPMIASFACPGAPACRSGHIDTRAIARRLADAARGLPGESLSVHVSGCPKGCAHPAAAEVTLVGGEKGVGIVVNGTAGATPLAYSQTERAVDGLVQLARVVRESRGASETMAASLARLSPQTVAAAFLSE